MPGCVQGRYVNIRRGGDRPEHDDAAELADRGPGAGAAPNDSDHALQAALREQARRLKDPPLPIYYRLLEARAMAGIGAMVTVALLAASFMFVPHMTAIPVTVVKPPDSARSVRPDRPLVLTFSVPMDPHATARAIQIRPPVQTSFHWTTPRTLQIVPVHGPLAAGTAYEVVVGSSARTADERPLSAPVVISFVTARPAPPAPAPPPAETPPAAPSQPTTPPAGHPPAATPTPTPTPTPPTPTPTPAPAPTPSPKPSPAPSPSTPPVSGPPSAIPSATPATRENPAGAARSPTPSPPQR